MGLLCNYSMWLLSMCTFIPLVPVISRPSTIFQFPLKNTERLLGKSSAWEIFVTLLDQLQSNCVTLRCAEGINRSLKQHEIFLKVFYTLFFLVVQISMRRTFYYTYSVSSCYTSPLQVEFLFAAVLFRISPGPHHFLPESCFPIFSLSLCVKLILQISLYLLVKP